MDEKHPKYLKALVVTGLSNLKWIVQHLVSINTCNLSCYEVGHTWTPHCHRAFLDILLSSSKYSLKIYTSLYVLTALIKRRKWGYYKNEVCKDILRSTAFLTANACVFICIFCIWRNLIGFYIYGNAIICSIPFNMLLVRIETKQSKLQEGFNYTSLYLPALFASAVAINIERPSRRGMLALYMTNLGVETLYRMLRARNLVPNVPGGEIILFCIALSGFMHLYRQSNKLDDFLTKVISYLFGNDETPERNIMPHDTTYMSLSAKVVSFLPPPLKSLIAKLVSSKFLTARHPACMHHYGCLMLTLQKYTNRFMTGFGAHALLRLPGQLGPILSGKKSIFSWLFGRDNVSFGAFLAGMSSLHQLTSCLLRWLRGKTNPSTDGLISGAVAGLALYHYRSSVLALYALIRLIDVIVRQKAESGQLPTVKNAYMYLYAVTTALLFHAAVWEPHNIRPAYWKFMMSLTGQKFSLMNRQILDKYFGVVSSKLYPNYWPPYDPRFTNITPAILKDITKFAKH